MVYIFAIVCYSVGMYECFKYAWLCLAVFSVFGLVASLPLDKWQKSYLDEYYRIKTEPQRRIDAAYRYIEDVENGVIETSSGVNFETYLKAQAQETPIKSSSDKPYQKPLYVRDKDNPEILHPYTEE